MNNHRPSQPAIGHNANVPCERRSASLPGRSSPRDAAASALFTLLAAIAPIAAADPFEPSFCDVRVSDSGAAGDNATDDTTAIQAAIANAADTANSTLCFDSGIGYKTTGTITVPPGMSVHMNAPIIFHGDNQTPALVIGAPASSNEERILTLDVYKASQSDWSDEDSVGIRLYNLRSSKVHIRRANRFTIGVQAIGAGTGFVHNQVDLGSLIANRIGLDLTNDGIGWTNENLFLNGHFSSYSNVNTGQSRYGVRITSAGSYKNNANLFVKPSFQMQQTAATPGQALPVLIEHGSRNRFLSSRNEGNDPDAFALVQNESTENEFDVLFGDTPKVVDTSRFPASVATSNRDRQYLNANATIFSSGAVHRKAERYNVAGDLRVPGLHLAESGSGGTFPSRPGITLSSDYLEIASGRAVGVFVDTSIRKRFVIRKDSAAGYPGRIAIRAYDAGGAVLFTSTPANYPVRSHSFSSVYDYSAYGGVYLQGSGSDNDFYISLSDEVQRIAVLIAGFSNPARLKSFSIASVDGGSPAVWPGYEEPIPNAYFASAPPTGACTRGAVIHNANPAVDENIGWVCVADGTRDWLPFGRIYEP